MLKAQHWGEIDEITAAARMFALHAKGLRHPPPACEIPTLSAGELSVDEEMTLLRRAT